MDDPTLWWALERLVELDKLVPTELVAPTSELVAATSQLLAATLPSGAVDAVPAGLRAKIMLHSLCNATDAGRSVTWSPASAEALLDYLKDVLLSLEALEGLCAEGLPAAADAAAVAPPFDLLLAVRTEVVVCMMRAYPTASVEEARDYVDYYLPESEAAGAAATRRVELMEAAAHPGPIRNTVVARYPAAALWPLLDAYVDKARVGLGDGKLLEVYADEQRSCEEEAQHQRQRPPPPSGRLQQQEQRQQPAALPPGASPMGPPPGAPAPLGSPVSLAAAGRGIGSPVAGAAGGRRSPLPPAVRAGGALGSLQLPAAAARLQQSLDDLHHAGGEDPLPGALEAAERAGPAPTGVLQGRAVGWTESPGGPVEHPAPRLPAVETRQHTPLAQGQQEETRENGRVERGTGEHKPRRRTVKWTAAEVEALKDYCCRKIGTGLWAAIKRKDKAIPDSEGGPKLGLRSQVDLKDKWRNLIKAGKVRWQQLMRLHLCGMKVAVPVTPEEQAAAAEAEKEYRRNMEEERKAEAEVAAAVPDDDGGGGDSSEGEELQQEQEQQEQQEEAQQQEQLHEEQAGEEGAGEEEAAGEDNAAEEQGAAAAAATEEEAAEEQHGPLTRHMAAASKTVQQQPQQQPAVRWPNKGRRSVQQGKKEHKGPSKRRKALNGSPRPAEPACLRRAYLLRRALPPVREAALAAHTTQDFGSLAGFEAMLQAADKPVLVVFSTTWCGPCKLLDERLQHQLVPGIRERMALVKVDSERSVEVADAHRVQSLPTLILFRRGGVKGKPVDRVEGLVDILDLQIRLMNNL
eukprot:scaffold14.g1139.t1